MHLSYVLMGVTVNKNVLRVSITVLANILAIALNKNEKTESYAKYVFIITLLILPSASPQPDIKLSVAVT